MNLAPRSNAVAAALLVLAALLILAIWYIHLFEGLSLTQHWRSQLEYDFLVQDEHRWLFTILAAAPILGFVLAGAYLLGVAARSSGAIVLLGANAALALSVFLTANAALAFFFALPMYWGYRCFRATTRPSPANPARGGSP